MRLCSKLGEYELEALFESSQVGLIFVEMNNLPEHESWSFEIGKPPTFIVFHSDELTRVGSGEFVLFGSDLNEPGEQDVDELVHILLHELLALTGIQEFEGPYDKVVTLGHTNLLQLFA